MGVVITLLKDAGLYNLAAFLFFISCPPILFTIWYVSKVVSKAKLDIVGELKTIAEDMSKEMETISKDVREIRDVTIRNDERIKAL